MTNQKQNNHLFSLLDTKSLSLEKVTAYLHRTKRLKQSIKNKTWQATCLNKTVLSVFFETSTRTRVSFEMAIHHLGAKPILFDVSVSSTKKGETLEDMIQNLAALGVDAFVIRHHESKILHTIASYTDKAIINAGDGTNEHPTQALLDLFSIQEMIGEDWKNKRILICGDIKHSRVAHSNLWLLKTLGAHIFVSGPKPLIPENLDMYQAEYIENMDSILPTIDAINVLRIQKERQGQPAQKAFETQENTHDHYLHLNKHYYRDHFGLTKERLQRCKEHVLILHPGPVNRGVEIDIEVIKSPQSILLKQVENGLFVRMACLEKCLLN